jgi:predicted RNA-binding Zn-ribbon protein involved in translation (DUF1610 family)
VYAKKNGFSCADAGKKIVEKGCAMIPCLARQERLASSDDAKSSEGDNMPAEHDSIKFACPHCGQHLDADYSMVNMDLVCPTCNHPINVPAPESVRQDEGNSHA